MDRVEFDKLEALEQVKYINKSLLEGHTLTNLCKYISIGRSTIRDRFKRLGYEYNKSTNQYESIIEIVEAEKLNSTILSAGSSETIQQSSRQVVETDKQILTDIINSYDDNLSKLNEMYNWYKLQSSRQVVETDKFKVDDFKGDIVTRSYKLYEPIQKEFADFCKANNKYKVQDILCQFIKEALEKYK